MNSEEGELPPELDFFKYAKGSSGKRKANDGTQSVKSGKRRKIEDDSDEADRAPESQPPTTHRVIAKGSNVPEPAYSFDILKERYQISSYILSNLLQNGYAYPTSIQSSGIPILLEVTFLSTVLFKDAEIYVLVS